MVECYLHWTTTFEISFSGNLDTNRGKITSIHLRNYTHRYTSTIDQDLTKEEWRQGSVTPRMRWFSDLGLGDI